jgi:hypothetical protein
VRLVSTFIETSPEKIALETRSLKLGIVLAARPDDRD